MRLKGKKIGIMLEADFAEYEIFFYQHFFPSEGADLHFLTRLWGQPSLTFNGHEWHVPFECHESFEDMDDDALRSYDAIIVPGGIVSDRLRYTEDINTLPPAVQFLKRAFAESSIVKGINCHGIWLCSLIPEVVRGRDVVAHINLLGDVRNMGANYVDRDVVEDGDLITGRSAGHCGPFAQAITQKLAAH
jgi:protease I